MIIVALMFCLFEYAKKYLIVIEVQTEFDLLRYVEYKFVTLMRHYF